MVHDFKTFNQLVEKARQDHNIQSNDSLTSIAFLKEHSYYTLVNGYQRALESKEKSEFFKDGFTIEQLGFIQINETLLSSNLLWLIISVEKHFKTLLQNQISEKIGIGQNDYLIAKPYSGNDFAEKNQVINKLKTVATGLYRGREGQPVYTEHVSNSLLKYRKEGNVPPWILVNDLTLGEAMRWFNILPSEFKKSIVSEFNINISDYEIAIEFFPMAMDLIRQYRNGLAHGDIINKIRSTTELHIDHLEMLFPNTSIISRPEYTNNNIGRSDLYALLLSLVVLSSKTHIWLFKNDFLNRLEIMENVLKSDSSSIRRILNVPDNLAFRINLLIPDPENQYD